MKKLVTITLALVTLMLIPIQINAEEDRYLGNLKIAGTNIDVDLYWFGSYETSLAQACVNQRNNAVFQDFSFEYGYDVVPLIADHRNQGFDELYDVIEGETIATITYADGSSKDYICREKDRCGTNDDVHIMDSYGNNSVLKYPSDWIAIYTCNPEGWWSITITFWEPIY